MAWQWVDNLLGHDDKKKFYWNARCPYMMCPSNRPYRGVGDAKLKFIQNLAPMVVQYKCKDCGCLTNFSLEHPDDENQAMRRLNPAFHGGEANYKLDAKNI